MASNLKDEWIKKTVNGKSFADIGGLWGTVNEKISVAIGAGASRATMVDITPPDARLWRAFDQRCANLGVSGYESISADATREESLGLIGVHDVIHCSGIIYHLPDPLSLLHNLRKLCGEFLILGSTTIPTCINLSEKILLTDGGTAYFIPSLNSAQIAFFSDHFDAENLTIMGINGSRNVQWYDTKGQANFAPWWWLFSTEYLSALLALCGFEVLESTETWPNKAHAFLCRKRVLAHGNGAGEGSINPAT